MVSTSLVGVSNQKNQKTADIGASKLFADDGSHYKPVYSNETVGIQWTRNFGRIDNIDDARKVRQTSDGGYILVGTSESYTPDGNFDLWLIKTDKNGNEEWNRTYGDVGILNWTFGFSVEQTNDGGYVFVGLSDRRYEEDSHAWVVKTTANGIEQWNKTYHNSCRGFSIQQTMNGGYIIIGDSLMADTWLCRTDENGDILWEQTFYEADSSFGTCVQQTSDGGFIVVGRLYFHQNDDETGFLVKTDADGHEQWNKTYEEIAPYSGFFSIHQLPDGYIAAGALYQNESNQQPVWLVRTDEYGNMIWNRTFSFGPDTASFAMEVDCTSDGGFIVTGQTETTTVSGWILKTDAEGNLEWQIIPVKSYEQAFYSVQEISNGSFIVAGVSYKDLSGDAVLLKIGHAPQVTITKPIHAFYFFNKELRALCFPFIIGPITVEADVYDSEYSIERVEFAIDDVLMITDTTAPYSWRWITPSIFIHTITVTAYNSMGNCSSSKINVLKII